MQPYEVTFAINPILQRKKLRLSKVKDLCERMEHKYRICRNRAEARPRTPK